jgi:hypothetical protein
MLAIRYQRHHTFPCKGLNNLVELLGMTSQLLVRVDAAALLGRGLGTRRIHCTASTPGAG